MNNLYSHAIYMFYICTTFLQYSGHGDPRQIKELLREAGELSVWLDIEQVGRVSGVSMACILHEKLMRINPLPIARSRIICI